MKGRKFFYFLKSTFIVTMISAGSLGCTETSTSQTLECVSKITAIKKTPLKREVGIDINYDFFEANNGDIALRNCLVANITNETSMMDPGPGPVSYSFKVGDMSLFILSDFYDLEMKDIFPDELEKRFEVTGIAAYFEYVRDVEEGRLVIRENVESYYKN